MKDARSTSWQAAERKLFSARHVGLNFVVCVCFLAFLLSSWKQYKIKLGGGKEGKKHICQGSQNANFLGCHRYCC